MLLLICLKTSKHPNIHINTNTIPIQNIIVVLPCRNKAINPETEITITPTITKNNFVKKATLSFLASNSAMALF